MGHLLFQKYNSYYKSKGLLFCWPRSIFYYLKKKKNTFVAFSRFAAKCKDFNAHLMIFIYEMKLKFDRSLNFCTSCIDWQMILSFQSFFFFKSKVRDVWLIFDYFFSSTDCHDSNSIRLQWNKIHIVVILQYYEVSIKYSQMYQTFS